MKRFFFYQIPALSLLILIFTLSCRKIDNNLPTVTTSDISSTTASTAVCGGEVTADGGRIVTARGVCWADNQNPTIAGNKTTDGEGTGVFTSLITGLTPDRIYYMRAYATNSAGTAYGSEIRFMTTLADSGKDSITDPRNNHVYHTQLIGTQIWMAENLAFLPEVSGPEAGSLTLPHYYVYGYDSTDVKSVQDSANFKTYGVLYNWPAARIACPPGWHIPSEADWEQLVETLGSPAGGKLKETGISLLDSDSLPFWLTPNTGANNISGFTAKPAGIRYSQASDSTIRIKFRFIKRSTAFWSSTTRDDANTWAWHLYFDSNLFDRDWFSNSNGFSVRCLKD